jgi:hypothetical protein
MAGSEPETTRRRLPAGATYPTGRQVGRICHAWHMGTVIVILLVIWLVLAILGALLEGLFWLTVVAVVLLIGTAVYGWVKRKASNV